MKVSSVLLKLDLHFGVKYDVDILRAYRTSTHRVSVIGLKNESVQSSTVSA